jgi:hypothetical protein
MPELVNEVAGEFGIEISGTTITTNLLIFLVKAIDGYLRRSFSCHKVSWLRN